ncbi:MAG: hypothetical protein RL104_894, partial [Bacteroidota bacterium]
MSTPLVRIVHLHVAPHHREAFEAYVGTQIKVVANQPGCLSATWLRAHDGSYFT